MAAAILAVLLKVWIVPALVQYEVAQATPQFWKGQVEIREVEVNFFSPSRLVGLTLTDERNRPWLEIESVAFRFGDWPGTHPLLNEIVIERPDARFYFEQGRCTLPLADSPAAAGESGLESYIDLRNLIVHDASVTTLGDQAVAKKWSNIVFTGEFKGQRLEVWLNRYSEDGSDWLSVLGSVDLQTAESNLVVMLTQTADRTETAAVLSALGSKTLTSMEGTLCANFSLNGKLDDLSSIRLFGNSNVAGWKFYCGNDPLDEDLDLSVEMHGQKVRITSACLTGGCYTIALGSVPLTYDKQYKRLVAAIDSADVQMDNFQGNAGVFLDKLLGGVQIRGNASMQGTVAIPLSRGEGLLCSLWGSADVGAATIPAGRPIELTNLHAGTVNFTGNYLSADNLAGTAWGGELTGAGSVTFGPLTYDLRLAVQDVNVGPMLRTFKPDIEVQKGRASGWVQLGGMGSTVDRLTMDAGIYVDDMDLEVTPLFSSILRVMSIDPANIHGTNDLAAVLSLDWPVMRVLKARVANRLSAFDIEPGGTVNLDSGQMDFYVVAGALDAIRFMPLMPIMNLSKKLSRLHVQGVSTEPPAKLIRKEPITDVAQGTVDFFRDTVHTGGQLGKEILGTLTAVPRLFSTSREAKK